MGGGIYGAFMNGAMTMGNNALSARFSHDARQENYMYGEMAANAADARTRMLYQDLQSPSAIMGQLKAAGLSPALMYGGEMGGTVGQGAQGSGAAGLPTQVFGMSAAEAAQIGLTLAQTQKTKAETTNINSDTTIKRIEANMKGLENAEMANAWNLINSEWTIDGKDTSMYEIAQDCYTYEQFIDKLRQNADTENIKATLTTEKGQEITRSIFMGANKFHRDIMILSAESMNANFQLQVSEKLAQSDFAKLNADAACAELRKSISTNELDARQKEAWNNLLNRLEKSSPTMHDIMIVLGMIVNNALTNYRVTPNVDKKI